MNIMRSLDLSTTILIVLINVILILDIEKVGVAGRKGGGSKSTTRIVRSSGGSTSRLSGSSSYTKTKTRVRVNVNYGSRSYRYYNRPWGYGVGYSYASWHSYGTAGHIYGYPYYTRTRYYRDYPDREPTICYNSEDYESESENGTEIEYEYFICPNADLSDDYHYCCGDDDRQHCCTFWDSGSRAAGVVCSILIFFLIVALAAYFCCFRRAQPAAQPFFQSRVLSRRYAPPGGSTVQYTVASTGPGPVDINMPAYGQPVVNVQVSQPMYPDVSGMGKDEYPRQQPVMPGGFDGDGRGPSMSPPPPYGASPAYPAQTPYPVDPTPYPASPYPPAQYQSVPPSSSPYPAMPQPTNPYPQDQPPAPGAPASYGGQPYPASGLPYSASPAPPYMQ